MQDDQGPDQTRRGANPAASHAAPRNDALAAAASAVRAARNVPVVQQPEEELEESSAPSRFGGRALRGLMHLVMVLVPVILLPALAIGLGYVRLQHGPVSLPFLTGPIERGITAELPGITARIEDVVLRLVDDGRIEFRLRNLRLFETDGDLVASAPLAAVEISAVALRAFRIVPARVELIQPQLTVTMAENGRLALAFNQAEAPPETEVAPAPAPPPAGSAGSPETEMAPATPATTAPIPEGRTLRRIDLAKILADATARARRREDAVSYLREVGVREATLTFVSGARKTRWTIPQLAVDLEHRRQRSVVSGNATIASPRGPWTLTFLTEDHDDGTDRRSLAVRSSVRGLVPAALAEALPDLPVLSFIDMPLSVDATIDLAQDGAVRDATLAVEVGRGQLLNVSGVDVPVAVDAGLLKFRFDGPAGRLVLEPSTIVAGASRATLVGELTAKTGEDSRRVWPFKISARDGVLGAQEFGLEPAPIERLSMEGHVLPADGLVRIDSGVFKAAGAELGLKGDVAFKATTAAARLEGQMSPMTATALKTVWPKALAPGARIWVGEHLRAANIKGGTLRWTTGMSPDTQVAMHARPEETNRFSLAIEASEVQMAPIDGGPVIDAPRVLTRLEGHNLEINIPDSSVGLPSGRRVPLKGTRFVIEDVRPEFPQGEVTLRVAAPLGPVLELADQPPFDLLKQAGFKLDGAEGKVDAQLKVGWQLTPKVDPADVRVEGKGRISDGRMKQLGGAWDVQGVSVAFDIGEKAADATGDMLVAGVPVKLAWQRIFGAPADKQPPLRLTAKVDNADRNQLGLDVNHIIQGDVPIEVTVTRGNQGESNVRFRADLTGAELGFDSIAWKKPSGRAANLQCDVVRGTKHKTELQGFKLAGDDIAIEGWAALGVDNRLREFHFKDFSLNVVSRLDVQGALRPDNVWDIKARGPTFDGRDFFRALFQVGQLAESHGKQMKPRAGIDLAAEIDTVLGFSETSLRTLKLKLSRRGDKLAVLDARGTLDGGKPLVVEMRVPATNAPRMLLADSTDAGQAFRLVGFYPNVQGGRVRLEVNVDGSGSAEKTGILWVDNFRILGDPVISEVVGSVDTSRPAIETGKRGKPKVVRETLDFDAMKAPFQVGHGQFVLKDSYVKGPLLGATLRGKVDYNGKSIDIGGTYIPLQGLNNMLGEIPVIGQILSGPRGEGIFGITFAIQGAMADPQVIVNPLSMVAPGIFREIFQMSNPDTAVRPLPAARQQAAPAEARVRASSTPAGTPSAGGPKAAPPAAGAGKAAAPAPKPAPAQDGVDGWSSDTRAAPPRR